MERQGSVLDLNEPSNTGMMKQSSEAKPLSDDEDTTLLQGAWITHQPDTNGKETFKELYFERYKSLHGPGDLKYEEALQAVKTVSVSEEKLCKGTCSRDIQWVKTWEEVLNLVTGMEKLWTLTNWIQKQICWHKHPKNIT